MAAARALAQAADVINTLTLAQAFDYKEEEPQVLLMMSASTL